MPSSFNFHLSVLLEKKKKFIASLLRENRQDFTQYKLCSYVSTVCTGITLTDIGTDK